MTDGPGGRGSRRSRSGAPTAGARWHDEYTRIDPTKVVEELAADGAAVACLGPGLPPQPMLEVAEAFDRDHPEVRGPRRRARRRRTGSGPAGRRARRGHAGADREQLPIALRRALGAAELRRANLVGDRPGAPLA